MPKAAPRSAGSKASNRAEPYTKSSPERTKEKSEKENKGPRKKTPKQSDDDHGDYRNIPLDEIKNEIPCYDNAATVRRKLHKLLNDKSIIPGTNKKWTQVSMVGEMQELEKRGHPVKYNPNASGPSTRSLSNFLKKSGQMTGGDSPCYYWGYVLLEKLRIHKREKKSKPRLKAEEE